MAVEAERCGSEVSDAIICVKITRVCIVVVSREDVGVCVYGGALEGAADRLDKKGVRTRPVSRGRRAGRLWE